MSRHFFPPAFRPTLVKRRRSLPFEQSPHQIPISEFSAARRYRSGDGSGNGGEVALARVSEKARRSSRSRIRFVPHGPVIRDPSPATSSPRFWIAALTTRIERGAAEPWLVRAVPAAHPGRFVDSGVASHAAEAGSTDPRCSRGRIRSFRLLLTSMDFEAAHAVTQRFRQLAQCIGLWPPRFSRACAISNSSCSSVARLQRPLAEGAGFAYWASSSWASDIPVCGQFVQRYRLAEVPRRPWPFERFGGVVILGHHAAR